MSCLFVSAILALGSALLAACNGAESAPPPGPPNFLIILADDLGAERISLYENAARPDRTPNIVALGRNGLVFDNVWSMPACSPTRAALLTGEYPRRTGIGYVIDTDPGGQYTRRPVGLDTSAFTLPRALAAAGYASAIAGKWHLGAPRQGPSHPQDVGFDHHSGPLRNLKNRPRGYFEWEKTVDGKTHTHDVYATTDTTNDALAFAGRLQEPWLIVVSYNAPHKPAHVPPAPLHTYQGLKTARQDRATAFRAMVEAMDTEIGRLLSGVAEYDPFVIFLGDNGTPGWVPVEVKGTPRGKGTILEAGVHVPFIVKHSSIVSPGRRVEAITSITDIFATLVEVSGAEIAPGRMPRDSVSFAPHLRSASAPPVRDWMFTEIFWPNGEGPYRKYIQAVRDQRYKLVRKSILEHDFYDLLTDPRGVSPRPPEPDEVETYLRLWQMFDQLPAVGRPES